MRHLVILRPEVVRKGQYKEVYKSIKKECSETSFMVIKELNEEENAILNMSEEISGKICYFIAYNIIKIAPRFIDKIILFSEENLIDYFRGF